jgi:hypothetical protein
MPGFDYARMQSTATRLLDRFNQGVIVLTKTVTAPGPNAWTPGEATTTEYPLKATAKGVSKQFIDGTTILATDIEITAAAFGADPTPADAVTLDGKSVTVLRVWRIPAAGTLVAWKFIVRG